jgi:hypothetical protein
MSSGLLEPGPSLVASPAAVARDVVHAIEGLAGEVSWLAPAFAVLLNALASVLITASAHQSTAVCCVR